MKFTLELFNTEEFIRHFKSVLEGINRKLPASQDRKANPYNKLREKGLLYRLDFIAEYILCVQKKSALPSSERWLLLAIGDHAIQQTLNELNKKNGKDKTDNNRQAV